jgi:hypothetical protein
MFVLLEGNERGARDAMETPSQNDEIIVLESASRPYNGNREFILVARHCD